MIFNFAGSVSFTEKFKKAIATNVRGVRELIELAKQCKNLKLFCHISTSNWNLKEEVLEEKPYKVDMNLDLIISMSELFSESIVEDIFQQFIDENLINSYVFTKGLGEALINEAREDFNLPVIICRPSLVVNASDDPCCGWNDSMHGLGALSVAIGKGVLRTIYLEDKCMLQVIPVDLSVKDILLCSMDFLVNSPAGFVYNLKYFEIDFEEFLLSLMDIYKQFYPFNGMVW